MAANCPGESSKSSRALSTEAVPVKVSDTLRHAPLPHASCAIPSTSNGGAPLRTIARRRVPTDAVKSKRNRYSMPPTTENALPYTTVLLDPPPDFMLRQGADPAGRFWLSAIWASPYGDHIRHSARPAVKFGLRTMLCGDVSLYTWDA